MALDNREWALVIWLTIALIGVFLSANLRQASWALLKALGQPSIVSVLALLFAYIAPIILGLWHLGWWGIANLKTTLIWAFGSACVAVFNVHKVEDDASFFQRALGEVIGVAVVVDFLTAVDTFPLWVEFFIAGGAFLLALLSAVSAKEPSQRLVHRGANALLIALGLLMLGKSIFHITVDFNDFAKMQTVREFLLPIILGLLLLPFLFLLNAYLVAESVLVAFKHQRKAPKLARYAGAKLLRHLGLDMRAWRQWQRHAGRFNLSSFAEVEASVLEVKKTRRRQKNPHRVRPVMGWLPEDAMGFLSGQGLKTRPYYRADDREWLAASAMVDLGIGILPNNVAYYISGDAFSVKELRLKLNINSPEEQEGATENFGLLCHELLKKAFPFACAQDQPFELEVGQGTIFGGHSVRMTLFEWSGGIKGGFDLTFVIAVPEDGCATD
ncbi:hypothetical protein JH286_16175 [Xanthomonas campestris pv. campestris]|uniref:hypothetical protein n=1 Tax=Xanthomonas campestris TaxID=339 RepID=UPI0023688EA9|nr:hypothetical protein [Xanthomonas campestris]WDJ46372.1 hypothetical protein JH286_16175 [Xanthomonas campestris pv. campestris]